MEEKTIDKLVFRLTNREYAIELKEDIISVGVPKNNFQLFINDDNTCTLVINDVLNYMSVIIKMFKSEPYDMSMDEISELLHINIIES